MKAKLLILLISILISSVAMAEETKSELKILDEAYIEFDLTSETDDNAGMVLNSNNFEAELVIVDIKGKELRVPVKVDQKGFSSIFIQGDNYDDEKKGKIRIHGLNNNKLSDLFDSNYYGSSIGINFSVLSLLNNAEFTQAISRRGIRLSEAKTSDAFFPYFKSFRISIKPTLSVEDYIKIKDIVYYVDAVEAVNANTNAQSSSVHLITDSNPGNEKGISPSSRKKMIGLR